MNPGMSQGDGRPIRICLVAPKSYPLFNPEIEEVFGGAEVDLYYLALELAKDARFEVTVIVGDYGQDPKQDVHGVSLIRSLNFREGVLGGAAKLWQAFGRADANLFLIKTVSPGVPLLALYCLLHGKVFMYRTSSAPKYDQAYRERRWFMGKAFDWALRRAKVVFAQSAESKADLERVVGIRSVEVIPNGHPLGRLEDHPRDSVLWVGRSDRMKRPRIFIDLADQVPDQSFVMICQRATGDRDYEALRARARDVRNLRFMDRVPFHRIGEHFRSAKVLVNTSDSEGFANTFIQAAQWAVPILSLQSNPDNFLEQYNCGIGCSGSFERLVQGLRFLLEKDRFIEIGSNARRYAEDHHDLGKIVETYKQMFRTLV